MRTTQDQSSSGRSTFVTVLAWIFIVLAGMSTLVSIAQNVMLQTMFSDPQFNKAMEASNQPQNVPVVARFMFNNFRLIFAAFFVLSATTFVSAIGLLKRWNWARLTFIGIMAFGILWNVFGIVMQISVFSSSSDFSVKIPPDQLSQFKTMMTVTIVIGGLMALVFSVLFGWIIKRLVSQPIRREFEAET